MSDFDDRDRAWEDRADRAYTRVTERPGRTLAKWGLGLLAIGVALALIAGAISWVSSWGGEAARVTGVENTREQVTRVLELDESMIAAAQNACQADEARKEDGDPTIIEDPSLAYDAVYRRSEAEYNRRMGNIFEAYVPSGNPLPATINHLPRRAPSLEDRQAEVC